MLFYDRTAVLTIGTLVFVGRIVFSIEKEYSGAPPCEIKAYNLSKTHRGELEAQAPNKLIVYLSAGYGGTNKLIYAGRVLYTDSLRNGADIVTSFHCSVAAPAQHSAALSLSGSLDDFGVYQRCLGALAPFGVVKGYLSPAVEQTLRSGTYSRGYAGVGYASKFLGEITKRHGLHWSIDGNNCLNIHSKDAFEDSERIVLNANSGMIGFPTKTQVSGCYKVRALLNAELSPGKRIKIESEQLKLNGDVKIIKSTHVGDTLEGDWYSEVEAMDLHHSPNITGVVNE